MTIAPASFYSPSDWNATCFECGRKFKASQLIKHWQGYYVCEAHWETRQPQDFVKNIVDDMSVPWSQPENSSFLQTCSLSGQSGLAGYAIAGCAQPGRPLPPGFS